MSLDSLLTKLPPFLHAKILHYLFESRHNQSNVLWISEFAANKALHWNKVWPICIPKECYPKLLHGDPCLYACLCLCVSDRLYTVFLRACTRVRDWVYTCIHISVYVMYVMTYVSLLIVCVCIWVFALTYVRLPVYM